MNEDCATRRRCWAMVMIIVFLILVGAILLLITWDSSTSPQPPAPPSSETIDEWTYPQFVAAPPGKSAQQQINTTNGSIVGDTRQIFLPPPVDTGSQLRIGDGEATYRYDGTGANGFEIRWLGYTQNPSLPVLDLSDVRRFAVDVPSLDLGTGTTFTLQMNVMDTEGLESSVIEILTEPKTALFEPSAFIGNEPGQRLDFSHITGMWLGGDFRTTQPSVGARREVTLKPLLFVEMV